jgi:hypothetical protein
LIVKQVITLKDESDVLVSQGCPLLAIQLMNRNIVKVVFAAPTLIVHAKNMQQGRLTAPDGPMIETNSPGLISRSIRRKTYVLAGP